MEERRRKTIARNLFSGEVTLLKMQHLDELVQVHFDACRILGRWGGLAAKCFERPAAMQMQQKNGSAPTFVQLSAHSGSSPDLTITWLSQTNEPKTDAHNVGMLSGLPGLNLKSDKVMPLIIEICISEIQILKLGHLKPDLIFTEILPKTLTCLVSICRGYREDQFIM